MTQKYRPLVKTWPHKQELPPEYYAAIGEIIFRWNRVENAMFIALKRMLGITIKQARITLGEPRPDRILDRIKELADINEEELGNLGELPAQLTKGEDRRNWLCHCLWLDKDGQIVLQRDSGTTKIANHGNYNRRIFPDPIQLTEEWLKETVQNAKDALTGANLLAERTKALTASRPTRQLNTPPENPTPVHSSATLQPQPHKQKG